MGIQRKLEALKYRNANGNFNDTDTYRNAVAWLEEKCIHNFKDPNLGGLKHVKSEQWATNYSKYLTNLGCPVKDSTPMEQLDWLAGHAVRLEYADNVDKYNKVQVTDEQKSAAPNIVSSNPLDELDFQSNEFKNGVHCLAKLLNVTPHVDHLVTLKAISKLVQKRLSPQALENPNAIVVKGVAFPLNEMNIKTKSKSAAEDDAIKILRLLYIHNLRELQTLNNETIVAIQQITANPKTDTKLGKVGF